MSTTEREEQTWPPPPERDDPMTEHDEFLTALLRSPAPQPLTRLRLYRALGQETGLGLWQCVDVVNGYCERFGIFPAARGLRLWLYCLPSLVSLAAAAAGIFQLSRLWRFRDAAVTLAARRGIAEEIFGVTLLVLSVLIAALLAVLLMRFAALRRARRQDAEARARMAQ